MKKKPKGKFGFASMDLEKRRAIASKGGTNAQATGRGHQWTSEEAVEAGRKGGIATGKSKRKWKKRRESLRKALQEAGFTRDKNK